MRYKPRLSAILSMLVLLSHTLLPSTAVVYAEIERELAARSPDEQLVFKKDEQVVSSKEDKDQVDMTKDEESFFTLHREDKEARDIRVELPEEVELNQDKTAEANQPVANGITQYLQEKAYQAALALQAEYNAQAEQARQTIQAEITSKEEQIKQTAEQDGTDPTQALADLQVEKEQKLAGVQTRQAQVQEVNPLDPRQLVEFKKKDEAKQESRKLIFHFQEGQTDVGMVLKVTKPGNYSLSATYEKEDKKYRSYPLRLKVQEIPAETPASEPTPTPSPEGAEKPTENAPPSSSEPAPSSENAGEKPSTNQKVDEKPASESSEKKEETDKLESKEEKTGASSEDKETSDKGKADKEGETDKPTESPDKAKEESAQNDKAKKDKKETNKEIDKKKQDFIDRSRALTGGRSSFFAAGDLTADRANNPTIGPEDFIVSYQPRATTVQAGSSLVYDLQFRISGALLNDIKNIDVKVHLLPTKWDSPRPAAKLVSKMDQLALFGVRPTFNEADQTLNYHFDKLSPAITGIVPVVFETTNGTTVDNTIIAGRVVSSQNGQVFEETNADDVYIRSEKPKVNVSKAPDGKVAVFEGETIKWKIRATFRGSKIGTQFIKEGSKIRLTENPEDGQSISDADRVIELDVPSYEEQEKNLKEHNYLFTIEKTVETRAPASISGDSHATKTIHNTVQLEASSLEGTNDVTGTSSKAEMKVVKEAAGIIPPIEGEFVTPVNRAPGPIGGATGLNQGGEANRINSFPNEPGRVLEFETLTAMMPYRNQDYRLDTPSQDLNTYWYYKAWRQIHRYRYWGRWYDETKININNLPRNQEEVLKQGTETADGDFNPFLNPYTKLVLNQYVDANLNIKGFNIYVPGTMGRENQFSDYTTYTGMSPEYSHYYPSGRIVGKEDPAPGDIGLKLPGDKNPTYVFNGSEINARVESLPIRLDVQVKRGDDYEWIKKEVNPADFGVNSAERYGWFAGQKYFHVPIEELGLTTEDHIASFRVVYGDLGQKYRILPWFWGGVVTEYVPNDPNFTGTVTNRSSIDGTYILDGKEHDFTRRPVRKNDYDDPDANVGSRSAILVAPPPKEVSAQVTPRFVLKNDGNIIHPGLNRIEVNVTNLPESTGTMDKYIKASVWLPRHVQLAENPKFTYDGKGDQGSYKVYKNWRGTGRDLVVVTFKKDKLNQNEKLSFQADVIVGDNADEGNEDENIGIDAYAGSTWTTLSGVDLVGDYHNSDGTINQNSNFLQDKVIKNITQGHGRYKFVSDDELKMEKFVRAHKDAGDDTGWLKGTKGKNNIAVVDKGGLIDYKITVKNNSPSERPINRMNLVDQFPREGDKTVLSGLTIPGIPEAEDKERESDFTPTLTGPITINEDWQWYLDIGLISIYYTKSDIPDKRWLTDDVVNAGFLRDRESREAGSYPGWIDQDDTKGWTADDWAAVRGFMIVKEKGREIPSYAGPLEIRYTMKAPAESPNPNKDVTAWNSIAGTMNGLTPVEATKVGVQIPGDSRELNIRVKKTDQDGKQALDAVLALYRVDEVEENGKLTEREVEVGRIATKKNKDYLQLTSALEKISRSAEVKQDYVLRELATQDGYILPSKEFRFTVKGDGSVSQTDDPQIAGLLTITSDKVRDGKPLPIDRSRITLDLTLKNTKLTRRKVKKVVAGDTSQVLKGASFKLAASQADAQAKKFLQKVTRTVTVTVGKETYTSKQNFVVTKDDPIYTDKNKEDKEKQVSISNFVAEDYTVTTGGDGLAVFDHLNLPANLAAGSLWAVETQAPEGYLLAKKPIEIPVKGDQADGSTLISNNIAPLPYMIKVTKIDADEPGKLLDARFYLHRFVNGSWQEIPGAHANTKGNSEVNISGRLQLNTNDQNYELFRIEERTEPDGYGRLPADIYFRYYGDKNGTVKLVTSDDKEITDDSLKNWLEVDISKETDKQLTGPHSILTADGKTREIFFKIKNRRLVTAKIHKVSGQDGSNLQGAEFRLADSWANAKAGKFLKLESRQSDWHSGTEERKSWTVANTAEEATVFTTDEQGRVNIDHLNPDWLAPTEDILSDEEIDKMTTEPEKSKARDKANRLRNARHYYLVETRAPAEHVSSGGPIALVMKDKSADNSFEQEIKNWKGKYVIRVSKLDKANPDKSLDARFYLHHFVNGQWQWITGARANTKNGEREVNTSGDLALQLNDKGYDLYKIEERTEPENYAKLATDVYFRIYGDSRVELVTDQDEVITDQSPEPYRSLKDWVEIDHKTAEKNHAVPTGDKSKMEVFFKIFNAETVNAKVHKVDSSEQTGLAGVEFRLADSLEHARAGVFLRQEVVQSEWHDSSGQIRYHWVTAASADQAQLFTTDGEGRFNIEHLNSALLTAVPSQAELDRMTPEQKTRFDKQAHYYLVETKAPDGYLLPTAPIPLVMKDKQADGSFGVELENALRTYVFKVTKVDADNPETKLDARFYVHHFVNGQWQWINGARAQTSSEERKPVSGNITLNPNQAGYEFFKLEESTPAPDHASLPADIYFRLYTDGHITFVTDEDKEIDDQAKPAFKELKDLVSIDFTTPNAAGQTVYKAKKVENRMEVYFRVKNKPQIRAKIHKVDAGNKQVSLKGAEFRLADSLEHAKAGIFLKEVETKHKWWGEDYKESRYHWELAQNSDEAALFTTGDDGRVDITHLDPSLLGAVKSDSSPHYYLVETKSPTGYMRQTQPIPLVMKDRGQDNSFDFEVENTKPAPFPKTGGMGMAVFVLSGLTLMMIGVLAKRRRQATMKT